MANRVMRWWRLNRIELLFVALICSVGQFVNRLDGIDYRWVFMLGMLAMTVATSISQQMERWTPEAAAKYQFDWSRPSDHHLDAEQAWKAWIQQPVANFPRRNRAQFRARFIAEYEHLERTTPRPGNIRAV